MSAMTLEQMRDELRAVAFNPGKDCWKRVLNVTDALEDLTSREAKWDKFGGEVRNLITRAVDEEWGNLYFVQQVMKAHEAHPTPQQTAQPAEQPKAEPVAWQCRSRLGGGWSEWQECEREDYENRTPLSGWGDDALETEFRALFDHTQPKPEQAVGDGVACHRLLYLIDGEEWASEGRPWVDGSPSSDVQSLEKTEPTRWRLEYAYKAPRPAVATAGDGVTAEDVINAFSDELHDMFVDCGGEISESAIRNALERSIHKAGKFPVADFELNGGLLTQEQRETLVRRAMDAQKGGNR